MFFTLHANDPVFVFSSQTEDIPLSDNDTLQLSNSRRVQCLSGPETDPGNDWGGQEGPPSPLPVFFNVLLVPLLFKFHDEALVRDKAAVSDREARSKYRPGPGSRACARTCVSSNTPSRLGLTRENRLCVNTHSDLDLRREGEEERWMEIWKKGGVAEGKRERERSGTEREGGVIFVVGATKGGTEKRSLTFTARISGWRASSWSRPYLLMPGSGSLMAALFYTIDQYWNGVGNKCGRREGAADGYHRL